MVRARQNAKRTSWSPTKRNAYATSTPVGKTAPKPLVDGTPFPRSGRLLGKSFESPVDSPASNRSNSQHSQNSDVVTEVVAKKRKKRQSINVSKKAKIAPIPEKERKRKKPRMRLGTKSLREIRQFQKTWHLLIPKLPFSRVVKETFQVVSAKQYRIQSVALMALQEAAEAYLIHLLSHTNLASIHAKRKTIHTKDMRFIRRIREDFI